MPEFELRSLHVKTAFHKENHKSFNRKLVFDNLKDLLRDQDWNIHRRIPPAIRIEARGKLDLDFQLNARVRLVPHGDRNGRYKLVFQDLEQELEKRGLKIVESAIREDGQGSTLAIDLRCTRVDTREKDKATARSRPQTFTRSLLDTAAKSPANGESTRPSFGPGGESPQHSALKNYVAKSPASIGLPASPCGVVEYDLASGDRLDVSFSGQNWVAVEVKSLVSTPADIARGMFQCIKYVAVMKAMQVVRGEMESANAILVLQGAIPPELRALRDRLRIDIRENVIPKPDR
jgi:hypothetical protein